MNDEQRTKRKPGPRQKRATMITTSIMMPPDLKEQLDTAAVSHDLSMAEVIRQALTEWLERHEGTHE